MTACTREHAALASQARKYGLGLVFATQAPRGLKTNIPGNAATQFYGLLNAPVQIAAAKEMARRRAGWCPTSAGCARATSTRRWKGRRFNGLRRRGA